MTSPLALVDSPEGFSPTKPSPRALEVLGRLDALRHELDQPDLKVADVVSISRQADILHAAARAARLGLDVANEAAETKLRAERKAGCLLRQLMLDAGPSTTRRSRAANKTGNQVTGFPRARESLPPYTLTTLNISPKDSSGWQLIAQLPEPEFEQRIAAIKGARRQLHSGTFVRAAAQYSRKVSGRPTTPTASVLRRVLLLLRNVVRIQSPIEQDLASAIVRLVEDWDVVMPAPAVDHARTTWVREVSCVLCARPRPASQPAKCPSCGGAWVNV